MQLLTQLKVSYTQIPKNAEDADLYQDFSASTFTNQFDLPHVRKATELINSTLDFSKD